MKVKITDVTPEYDWVIVEIDGKESFTGHSVPEDYWIALLKQAGVEVEEATISAHELGVCSLDCKECVKEPG